MSHTAVTTPGTLRLLLARTTPGPQSSRAESRRLLLARDYSWPVTPVLCFFHLYLFLLHVFSYNINPVFRSFYRSEWTHVLQSFSPSQSRVFIVSFAQLFSLHIYDEIAFNNNVDSDVPLSALCMRWCCHESSNISICRSRSKYGRSSYV